MQSTLKITSKGQVTLRQDLLKVLGVRPGDLVTVTIDSPGELRMRAAAQGGIESFIGSLTNDKKVHLTLDEINEITRKGWAGEL